MLPPPIKKAPLLDMSGNVILLHIDNIVPQWDTYTFVLDIKEPGRKQFVVRVSRDPIEKVNAETQTEHLGLPNSKDMADTATQTEPKILAIKSGEQKQIILKLEDEEISLNTEANFISCPTDPCVLLTCPPGSRGNLEKYLVRPFEHSAIQEQSAAGRAAAAEMKERQEERIRKRIRYEY
ncbi:hypothetical protein JVT61DRAFT_7560 [Boletus reticuloceps]|uniref:Uncharacterized protein n=1 Tax=Boletus reticuloceps TaxID=495285 RepID=A0A8I2YI14_9AGAM|nr:hypothetical protein JVT61DRAFT_7560 [Boletus reticuloceps]